MSLRSFRSPPDAVKFMTAPASDDAGPDDGDVHADAAIELDAVDVAAAEQDAQDHEERGEAAGAQEDERPRLGAGGSLPSRSSRNVSTPAPTTRIQAMPPVKK